MFVHCYPLFPLTPKDDGFAFAYSTRPLLCREIRVDGMREDSNLPEDLDTLITGPARTNSESIFLLPLCPLCLVLGSAVQSLRRGMEDERRIRSKVREIGSRIVPSEGVDNCGSCCRHRG